MERMKHMECDDSSLKRRALFAAVFSIIAAGSCTTLAGLLLTKFENLLGWSSSAVSVGIAINMVLYGLTAPFSIFAMEKFGIRRIAVGALVLLIVGCLAALIPNILLFNLSWGVLVGVGIGSLTMAYGALVARTWFGERQGTAVGVLTASAVLGQFALLPLWAKLSELYGWRAPLVGCAVLALTAIVVNFLLMPTEGARTRKVEQTANSDQKRFVDVFKVLFFALRSQPFWILVLLFVICGATTNGLLWSHFTPAAHDHGMSATVASTVLTLVGIFNIVGTVFSGWLSDRISPRLVLAFVFLARAGTLLWLPVIFSSQFDPQIVTFGILFGVLDVATVPPVITLCNRVFGREGPAIFGWINAFHQIGAGAMAASGGAIRESFGSYTLMWQLAGGLCFLAAVLVYLNRYKEHSAGVGGRVDARTLMSESESI